MSNENVIPFRRFTREDLINDSGMCLLRDHGTESGKRLYNFILDSFDDGMSSEAANPREFISVCTEVFNDMESDLEEK
jgi:hypothetical protein